MRVGATSSRGVLVVRVPRSGVSDRGRGVVVRSDVEQYGSDVVHAPRPAVTEIRLYPVKSCHGHRVDAAVVGRYGLQGDREWQVQGPDGQMMNQRKFQGLARVRPFPTPSGLCLEHDDMPALDVRRPDAVTGDGKTLFGRVPVADAGPEAGASFEQVLGIECRLTAIAWATSAEWWWRGSFWPGGVVRRCRSRTCRERRLVPFPPRQLASRLGSTASGPTS